MDPGDGKRDAGRQKKPYKRKLTERRRIQNRAAQKTYREKRKERLDLLERYAAAPKLPNRPAPPQHDNLEPNVTQQVSTADVIGLGLGDGSQHSVRSQTSSVTYSGPLSQPDDLLYGDPGCTLVPSHDLDFEELFYDIIVPRDLQTSPAIETVSEKSARQFTLPAPPTTSIGTSMFEAISRFEDDDAHGLARFTVASKVNLKRVLLAGLRDLASREDRTGINITSPSLTYPTGQLSEPRLLASLDVAEKRSPVPILPDPYRSSVHLRRQSLGEALFENARTIGLTLEQIMQPHCRSPFYLSLSSGQNNIPPDLKPTPSQIRFSHHPFLDLLPWPWLRERAVFLVVSDPDAYDRKQLKADIIKGGIKCWKSRGSATGQPWDRRSWEVEAWFLKKWNWMVEKDGEVEGQSRWWRALRGE